jgi:hypothetical protein
MGCRGVPWGAMGWTLSKSFGLFYGTTHFFRGLKNQSTHLCQYVPVIIGHNWSRVAHPAPGVSRFQCNETACPENRKEPGQAEYGITRAARLSFWRFNSRLLGDFGYYPK